MPYDVHGYDSAGKLHAYEMTEDGTFSGEDDLLTGWVGANPLPEPPEGTESPRPDAPLPPERVEAIRQHVSKLLTNVYIARQPDEAATPPTGSAAPSATQGTPAASTSAPRYTQTDLEARTVTDLRSMATTAQIPGASTMTKAELVTALLAHQGA